jgi:hypothetical protein
VARAIVQKLNLKGEKEWREWGKAGQRPSNIPSAPDRTYHDDGWISWPDWLGKEGGQGAMLPFPVARAIVQKLKLKNNKEWEAWRKSGQRPSNIPSAPDRTYHDDDWISMPDWLGKEGGVGAFLPFAVARAIVRKLKLKGTREWQAWSKAGKRPLNIPGSPAVTYRDDGWISMPDWLGKDGGRGAFLSFAEARSIVRKLNLKSGKEWVAWSKSGKRPSNIPSHPDRMYRDDGWISMPDWLSSVGGENGKKGKKRRKRQLAPAPSADSVPSSIPHQSSSSFSSSSTTMALDPAAVAAVAAANMFLSSSSSSFSSSSSSSTASAAIAAATALLVHSADIAARLGDSEISEDSESDDVSEISESSSASSESNDGR